MYTNIPTLEYRTTITIPFGGLQTVVDWCNNNCNGDWYYTDSDAFQWYARQHEFQTSIPAHKIEYEFFFEYGKECLLFKLAHQ